MIKSKMHFWVGIALGFFGLLFYANFREPTIYLGLIPAFAWLQWVDQPIMLPDAFSHWFPSFLHMISMSLFTTGLVGTDGRKVWAIPLCWLGLDLLFEFLQVGTTDHLLYHGTFDWVDVAAIIIATPISIWILRQGTLRSELPVALRRQSINLATALGIGCFMVLGSYDKDFIDFDPTDPSHYAESCTYPDGSVTRCEVRPIYLDWADLRIEQPVYIDADYRTEATQTLVDSGFPVQTFNGIDKPGKVTTAGNLLLVVDHLLGVHLFDNSDPGLPRHLAFIEAQGATDAAVNNGYAYINSYTDLLAIDLNDLSRFARTNNLFQAYNPNPWAALPSGAFYARPLASDNDPRLELIDIDLERGVIIGYENNNGDVFYFADNGL